MADPADLNVDELRRRARRRLVGAIVLALAAAVIVPMLLESDPKPLGESVAVKIPPVDDGKFVNRLSDGAPGAGASKDARKDVAADSAKRLADADKAPAPATPAPVPAPASARPSKYDTQLPGDRGGDAGAAAAPKAADDGKATKTATPVDAAPPATRASDAPPAAPAPAPAPSGAAAAAPSQGAASPSPRVDAKPEPAPAKSEAKRDAPAKSDAKPAPAPPPAPRADAAPPASVPAAGAAAASAPAAAVPREGFSVQLAAFSDDKGANALANRLKRGGYPAYTEPLKTSRGTLWRVRVGPYPSREAANGVRDKLKSEGQSGIVAAAH